LSAYIANGGFWRCIWVIFLVFMGSGLLCLITTKLWLFITKNDDKTLTVVYMTLFIPPIITMICFWRIRHSVGWLITAILFLLGLIGGAISGFEDDEPAKKTDTPKTNTDTISANTKQAEVKMNESRPVERDDEDKPDAIKQWLKNKGK